MKYFAQPGCPWVTYGYRGAQFWITWAKLCRCCPWGWWAHWSKNRMFNTPVINSSIFGSIPNKTGSTIAKMASAIERAFSQNGLFTDAVTGIDSVVTEVVMFHPLGWNTPGLLYRLDNSGQFIGAMMHMLWTTYPALCKWTACCQIFWCEFCRRS